MKEINKIHDKMPTDPFEAELLMMAEMVAGDKKKDQSDSDTDEENGIYFFYIVVLKNFVLYSINKIYKSLLMWESMTGRVACYNLNYEMVYLY